MFICRQQKEDLSKPWIMCLGFFIKGTCQQLCSCFSTNIRSAYGKRTPETSHLIFKVHGKLFHFLLTWSARCWSATRQRAANRVRVKCIQNLGKRKQGNRSTVLLFPPSTPPFLVLWEKNPKRKLETSPFPTVISCLPALIYSPRQSAQYKKFN